jgi:hypothetical protein
MWLFTAYKHQPDTTAATAVLLDNERGLLQHCQSCSHVHSQLATQHGWQECTCCAKLALMLLVLLIVAVPAT